MTVRLLPQNLITGEEARTLLGVTRQRVNKIVRDQKIPHQKIGTACIFRRADIERIANAPAKKYTPKKYVRKK